jgi:hypothetical protein
VLILASQALELRSPVKVAPSAEGPVVSWSTDTLCGTRLALGTTPQLLNRKLEGSVGLHHQVTVPDLKPGTTYHFSVGSSKHWLASGTLTVNTGGAVTYTVDGSTQTDTVVTPESKPKPLPSLDNDDAPKPPASKLQATPLKAPPTKQTWGYMASLQDHYDRHGKDFNCTSPDDYAAKAWLFLQYAKRNALPMKWDEADDTLRIWDPKTRAFAAFNRDGTTKTFFRPNTPSYWTRQPGRPIRAAELRF